VRPGLQCYSGSVKTYSISACTTTTLMLLPMSLYFDFFDVESGQTKPESGDSLRKGSNAKRRRSSEGVKYLRRRGCKIFTASASS
jgi:hypothetical protein